MKRRLTPEERDLWCRTVRNVAPLGVRRREAETADVVRKHPAPVAAHGASGKPVSRALGRPPPPAARDPFRAGDPRMERQARRGRLAIDATFDLHGHNQATARAALYGFLLEARRRGHRCVLVVTGKGGRRGEEQREGVLRAGFRRWMGEDDFHQHVVRVATAHQRHGGAGAFYVFLKTR